jgi:hypothetical protein
MPNGLTRILLCIATREHISSSQTANFPTNPAMPSSRTLPNRRRPEPVDEVNLSDARNHCL